MMWRVHPDHGENADTGKNRYLIFRTTPLLWRPSPNRYQMSALQPIADLNFILVLGPKAGRYLLSLGEC
jgi:hypothetical protein